MKYTITRKDLEDGGFSLIRNEDDTYTVKRFGYISSHKGEKVWKTLEPKKIVTKHKHGKDLAYNVIVFSIKGKTRAITLSRMIGAGEKGECPAGMDVDHINDNSLDDRLDNYQLITHKENIKKRGVGRNQYTYCQLDEDILQARFKKEYLRIYKHLLHDTINTTREKIKLLRSKWHELNKNKIENTEELELIKNQMQVLTQILNDTKADGHNLIKKNC